MTPSDQSYRLIPLTQGKWTIVDAADYEWLMQWKWFTQRTSRGICYAARNSEYIAGQKRYAIRMNRFILGLEYGDPRKGDHICIEATLDNRRSNLRITTDSQSVMNRSMFKNNSYGHTGVTRASRTDAWESRIGFEGRLIHLGTSRTFEDAVALRKAGEIKYFGEYARK